MPYAGVPPEKTAAMDSCVEKVMAGDSSLSKESAIAICHESVAKATTIKDTELVNVLTAKIHEAFTVAADQMTQRGYLDQEQRIALSGAIGDALGKLNERMDPAVASITISDEDAVAIADKAAETKLGSNPKENSTAIAKASAAILRQAKGNQWILASKANSVRFSVFKQADGAYRWLMSTSNAFEDRDGEILSEKALAADVARADALKVYGPLRWWHVEESHLGDCDFNAMHGKMLVESGTFKDARIAEAVAGHVGDLSGSLGFFHPVRDPDAEGVYNAVERFERSLLPKDKASNPWITLLVSKEEQGMDEKKIEKLGELIGDPGAVKDYLADVSDIEKRALDAGVRHKEGASPPPVAVDHPSDAAETKQEEDLEAKPARVRDAVYKLYPSYGPMTSSMWAEMIFADHVIICVDSKYFSAPYTDDGENVMIGDLGTWTEVQQEWVPAAAAPAPTPEATSAAPPAPEATMAEAKDEEAATRATWDTSYINDLPDSAFLFIESGGEKDDAGKTIPRSIRHFPYKNADGAVDLPHLRNAIARIPQSTAPGLNKEEVQTHAQNLLEQATADNKQDAPPADTPAPPDENTKIGDMTLGELTKLMSAVVGDMMADGAKAQAEKETVLGAKVDDLATSVTAVAKQVADILDETPRAIKRGERVTEQEKSKIEALPPEKQAELKTAVPTFDPHFTDVFLQGIKAAGGAATEQLVLGGGPPKK